MKSTSLHRITADKGNLFYKIMVRLLYFPLNYVNNRNPYKETDPDLIIKNFKPENFTEKYKSLDNLSSPSRKLSDLFWMSLDWKMIQQKCGEINICDLGCGTGKYYFKLQDYSGNIINKYYGFDITEQDTWKNIENEKLQFKVYDGTNLLDRIPKDVNLIISQSAIEHFQEDLTIFKQLFKFSENSEHNVHHIHLFPSAACLKMFRFHGVRQYTPRTVSKFSILTKQHEKTLYNLGGKHSNKIHLKYITGKDKRNEETEIYMKELKEALKKDFKNETFDNANFYALTFFK